MNCNKQNLLSFSAIFCPFEKILKKWKKSLEISLFYKSVPKIMFICYTVPEIWHKTDVIVIFHFGLYAGKSKLKKKKKMKTTPGDIIILGKCTINDVWFLRYEAWQTESFIILAHFLPFHPTNNSKKKKKREFWKNEKKAWRYHFTQVYQKPDHMLYCSWDMVCDRCNYFSFWASFALLPP